MGNIYHSSKLILATQANVDLETSWMEGYEKSKHSIIDAELHNPYPEDTKQYQYWLDGYDAGLMNEKPLFPDNKIANDAVYKPKNKGKYILGTVLTIASIAIMAFFFVDLAS
ncbi:hypothetical protein L3V83_11380 [Thiotrichales bacterium 19X7-9]|nr:hypothetical protein [Thiotrichales bacterium 19X7-9]